jgi:hypothetical protein
MHISSALKSLGITQCTIEGNPTTESEFRNAFKKVASIDAEGNPTFTDDWGFTWAELQAEYARLQAEYAAKEYQRNRAAEYPSFAEQFDTLYHGGYDAWKAQIDAIKLKYPKV